MLAMHTLSVRDALDYTLTAAPLLGAILAVPTLAAAAGHEPLPPWPTLPLEPRTLREHLVRSRAHLDAGSSAAHAHAPRAHAPHARGEPAESNRTRRPTQIPHTPPVNLPSTSDKPPTNLPQTSHKPPTNLTGKWYTCLSHTLLHLDASHRDSNVWALLILGWLPWKRLGSAGYLLSVLAGSAAAAIAPATSARQRQLTGWLDAQSGEMLPQWLTPKLARAWGAIDEWAVFGADGAVFALLGSDLCLTLEEASNVLRSAPLMDLPLALVAPLAAKLIAVVQAHPYHTLPFVSPFCHTLPLLFSHMSHSSICFSLMSHSSNCFSLMSHSPMCSHTPHSPIRFSLMSHSPIVLLPDVTLSHLFSLFVTRHLPISSRSARSILRGGTWRAAPRST